MTVSELISFIGFPAICGAIGYVMAKVKSYHAITVAVQNGVQALLRDRMLTSYHYCSRKESASVDEKENFEQMYLQYKALGGNGVIEHIYQNFLDLPLE